MSLRISVGRTSQNCDIQECAGERVFWVAWSEDVRGVCTRCMEELVCVRGWRMVGAIAERSNRRSHAAASPVVAKSRRVARLDTR